MDESVLPVGEPIVEYVDTDSNPYLQEERFCRVCGRELVQSVLATEYNTDTGRKTVRMVKKCPRKLLGIFPIPCLVRDDEDEFDEDD